MNTMTAPPILERLNALGDETRTRILSLLDGSEFTVSELCAVLQVPQPTVSRHLRTLSDEGWVEVRPEGRNRHYRLSPALDDAARSLWRIVRHEVGAGRVYRADAERARSVLEERRLKASAYFAETAADWDQTRAELFGSGTGLAPLLGLIDPSWTVGDLGCGTGALTARLAPFARRTIGVDQSEAMLEAARARLDGMTDVELRPGALEALPIEDGTLDLAVLALVLHYVVDPPAVLAEARRALAPGGRLLVLDMRRHERGPGFADAMGHVWPGFESERMSGWLADTRYGSVRVQPLAPEPHASGPLLFLASARA